MSTQESKGKGNDPAVASTPEREEEENENKSEHNPEDKDFEGLCANKADGRVVYYNEDDAEAAGAKADLPEEVRSYAFIWSTTSADDLEAEGREFVVGLDAACDFADDGYEPDCLGTLSEYPGKSEKGNQLYEYWMCLHCLARFCIGCWEQHLKHRGHPIPGTLVTKVSLKSGLIARRYGGKDTAKALGSWPSTSTDPRRSPPRHKRERAYSGSGGEGSTSSGSPVSKKSKNT
ncbi:hypothetical protein BJ508DRAFT_380409 [Ascobolus immersus RN42]|uniref:Uncharacterized protein n=1 Tax=Ascobolus immersus RN42 TaxID=1160509 RepID=A0A3N4HNE1_ASCIM|nr:hypothetical protein BJ508DRAFT_380409 [Ascobolus immersus RN42]